MSPKEKILLVLEEIAEQKAIQPAGEIFFNTYAENLSQLPHFECYRILCKLQDEGVIDVDPKTWRGTIEFDNPNFRYTPCGENGTYWFIVTDKFNSYLEDLKKEVGPFSLKTPMKNDQPVLWLNYTPARELILNDRFLLAKPMFGSENDVVFRYVFDNPNKILTFEEVKQGTGYKICKSFPDIIKDLGFSGDLRKAFFEASAKQVHLHNPILPERLTALKIDHIRIYTRDGSKGD